MPMLTNRLKLSLPLSNEYVSREVLVKAFEEIDRVIMLQGDLDSLKEIVNKYTDEAVKKLKDDTENKAGKPNGLATLDKDGKVPTTQLPKREAKDVNITDAKGYYSEKTVESALQQVGADLAETDKKTQLLQQGLNVLNAPTASPLSVEIQGRTLVNLLGQTNLDNTKYYVFVPHKGTTKITYGGNTYEGVSKFTGQATVSYTIKQDFRGKVAGNIVGNGHISKGNGVSTALQTPSGAWDENVQANYDKIGRLDNNLRNTTTNPVNGTVAQHLFSFNIIRTLEDKFGPQIWQGKTTLADKVAIAKQVITGITCSWWGFGSSATGNKSTLAEHLADTKTWFNYANHTESKVFKIFAKETANKHRIIGDDGFAHYLAYAEPSNGTVASVINTDYVELELEVNTSLPLLEDALYELDQATYNKINIDPEYSGQKLLDKFPYVQGVQHLNPVVVADGGNLIPPFTEWNLHPETTIISPYTMEVNTIGTQRNSVVSFLVNSDITYTFSYENANNVRYDLQFRSVVGGPVLSTVSIFGGAPATFKTPIGTTLLTVNAYNYPITSVGKVTFKQPVLVLGDKPKPFAPRNPSYLYTNTVLAGRNGVNDVLYQEDGQWKVLRRWERDVDIDGTTVNTENNSESVNKSGYKEMVIKKAVPQQPTNSSHIMVKPNRVVSTNVNAAINAGIDSFYIEPVNTNLYVRVSNEDSGFLQTYLPQVAEIQAYFNGWKVKTSDANGKPIAWKSVVDDKDAPTQTLAYVKANRAPNYTPYKLTYQLATPRVEPVLVEGDLAVSGVTQVTVDSGVVVREKIVPLVNSAGNYEINRSDMPLTLLKNKVKKLVAVYKNESFFYNSNNIIPKGAFATENGERMTIERKDFDPTAEYTVTYLVLDKHQFTTNPVDVKATYNQSLKTSVTELVERQADVATGLSILANATSENTKDIIGLKKATTDNTTDITDLKNKTNTTSAKVDKLLETLSRYRSNKDDNGIFRTIEWKTKSGILRRKAVITVSTTTGDYDKQIVTEYANDGTTITSTDEYKLILDGDGDIVNEVLQ